MRIRSIKPDFWKSDDTASLKEWHDRLVFIGLWAYVDDNGVGRDNEKLITAELFGLEEDPREAATRVRRALASLAERGMIARYEDSEGRRYLHITNWHHQKIDRPSRPRYPLPTSENVLFDEGSSNTHRALAADSLRAREDQGSGIRDQGSRGTGDQGSDSSAAMLLDPVAAQFDEFWDSYPRPEGKKPAQAAFAKALKRVTYADISDHLNRQLEDPNAPEKSYWPHAATWLNQDRWNDQFIPKSTGQSSKTSTTDARVSAGLSMAQRYAAQEAREEQQRLEIAQ